MHVFTHAGPTSGQFKGWLHRRVARKRHQMRHLFDEPAQLQSTFSASLAARLPGVLVLSMG